MAVMVASPIRYLGYGLGFGGLSSGQVPQIVKMPKKRLDNMDASHKTFVDTTPIVKMPKKRDF